MKKVLNVAGFTTRWLCDDHGYAAVVVQRLSDGKVWKACLQVNTSTPYHSGHLAERDVPGYLVLLASIPADFKPDVSLVDGAGLAHPRQAGTASVLGSTANVPTIGVTKSLFAGLPTDNVRALSGMNTTKPVFVSPGYGLELEDAVRLVAGCFGPFRRPLPIRNARVLAAAAGRDCEHEIKRRAGCT